MKLTLLKIAEIIQVVFSLPQTLSESRFSPTFFTRVRKMPFPMLLQYLLRGRKCATQANLNEFFSGKNSEVHMTQQALSKARSHFDHTPFQKAFYTTINAEYNLENDSSLKRYLSYKAFAIDGSIIALPNLPKLAASWGEVKGSPSARASIAYDMINDRIVEAELEPMATDERTLAARHISNLSDKINMEDALFIFDRGYASKELITLIQGFHAHFLMRVRRKFNILVDNAPKGDSKVEIAPGIVVRVVKFELSSGEIETLITDLFDLPFDSFEELYFLRWPVEIKYDIVKNKLEMPNFTGTSSNIILQDFWLSMLLANVAAVAKAEADDKIKDDRKDKSNKYEYQANVNNAIATVRNRFADAVFCCNPFLRQKRINAIIQEIAASAVPIRTDRMIPRKESRKVKYHHTKKSNV